MKQIIEKNSDGNILYKYYLNDRGEYHGLSIRYWGNGSLWWKRNWVNGKEYGLRTYYSQQIESGSIVNQTYYL